MCKHIPSNMFQDKYHVQIPKHLFLLSLCLSAIISFGCGRAAHHFLIGVSLQTLDLRSVITVANASLVNSIFEFIDIQDDEASCSNGGVEENDIEDDTEPIGEHLLVDIQNVSPHFLGSQRSIVKAMIDFAKEIDFPLEAYMCHDTKVGTSCMGSSTDSHIAVTTWIDSRVLLLDLFVVGSESLNLVTTQAEDFFAIADGMSDEEPRAFWWLKCRGYEMNDASDHDNLKSGDLYNFPVGQKVDYKKQLAQVQSKFQEIVVFEVLTPNFGKMESYKKSLSSDGSYEAEHPELFSPDRIIYLDGILQSRKTGDAVYHEALVHPTMFAHRNPKRVAIIGGGEGATLREVLKHDTVEKVVMIDIDEIMVEASIEYLPEWSDCSNLVDRASNCFHDRRAEVYFDDAFGWFKDRFLDGEKSTVEKFDVVIMDALDPQGLIDIVGALYTDNDFYTSLYNSLNEDGILVAQVGEATHLDDLAEEISTSMYRAALVNGLVDVGFVGVREYEEMNCGFMSPWAFMVGFKEDSSEERWFHGEDRTNLKIRQRLTPTIEGNNPLHYFDGSTMSTYWHPSRSREDVFCSSMPPQEGCGLDHGYEEAQKYLSMVHIACLRHQHNCSAIAKEADPGADMWLLEDPRFTLAAREISELMTNTTDSKTGHESVSKVLRTGAVIPPRARQGGSFNPFMDRQVKLEVATM